MLLIDSFSTSFVKDLAGCAGSTPASKLIELARYRRKLQRHHDVILACGAVINTEYDSMPENAKQLVAEAFQKLPVAQPSTKRKR